jgi:ABC-type nitrate/sulfonate/bicarbonate transport system substrate-binding protein
LAAAYNKGLIRDITTAVPGGVFVHGDRIVYYAPPQWAEKNPDLIKAFIKVQEKSVAYIKANPDEAAKIVFRELRQPLEVVRTQFKDPGNHRLVLPETDYETAVSAFKAFQAMAIANNDGIVSEKRKPLDDARIRKLFDPRFFRGGEFYHDENIPAGKKETSAQASPAEPRFVSNEKK